MMDRIYAESRIVIVAAAGDSAQHGLPGISIASRNAQGRVKTNLDTELIEVFAPALDLKRSTWVSSECTKCM